ncbi:hypothetical protein DAERI_030329 [Deinococcus aerius]|uniref:DUF4377 domain-containing protein n=1 Tax=Deinococcus aerius TaxID=200253 RepID=A0A2I9CTP5_9DEIO|nr:DUF4377 domain-containing protein [Deinococcus aerius]GBF05163.1 hypothetical protein DAERI_030329 [Deinococcus aerius]
MRRLLLVGMAAGLGLTACSDTHVKEISLTVAPNKTPCPESFGGLPRACLLVKPGAASASDVWQPFEDTILGFGHQSGHRYRLLVNATSYSSPIGDPFPTSYALKQVLEKTPDSTIAVPGQP